MIVRRDGKIGGSQLTPYVLSSGTIWEKTQRFKGTQNPADEHTLAESGRRRGREEGKKAHDKPQKENVSGRMSR